MSTDAPVKVLSILGNDYSIKAPEGEQQALVDAARMLDRTLAETKRRYPTLVGDKLLVLTALNLCSQQMELQREHQQALNRYQEQVNATVEVIARTIGDH
ncbi:cell division protein ZapA [Pseudomonas sp. nanlin1]|uniref:cell division protein ZapA n=1 Tax=Pseudomonas sp. nanlin1 TaxID=3040605 RepID=UPI00388E6D3D